MVLLKLWNVFLCFLTSAVATGNTLNGNDTDIVDAIAGQRLIIRTWPLNGSTLSINVKKGNITRLNAFFEGSTDTIVQEENGRLILKYNHTIREVSLLFDNISREDEGLYEIEESFYRDKMSPYETETEAYKRKDGRCSLKLNVLEPGEVKQGYAGEKIIMVFRKSSELSTLYNYDQMVALLDKSVCSILTDSHWYGRLTCTSDEFDKRYRITIDNVTQRDAGLYKVGTGRDESGRCFLNITDIPTSAVLGDNITIGWFYNQQGMKRTLLVIHPNQEVMMLLPQTNIAQIKSNFQHRLLYSGDASKRFMLFTLLNVGQSDVGLYTIETLHGNTIPGSKELIVEAETTNTITTDEPFVLESDEKTDNIKTDEAPIHESVSVAGYVIPVVTVLGVVCASLMMIVCLLCIQRKNSCRLEAVQRISLEKCETPSFAMASNIRRPLPMPPWQEVRSDQSVTQSYAIGNAVLGLHYSAINDLPPVHTECSSTYSLVQLEYDKLTLDNAVNCNKFSDWSNEIALAACADDVEDGSLGESPSASTFVTKVGIDKYKYGGNVQRQVAENVQVFYAKVKKRPIFSSGNTDNLTAMRRNVGLCGDGFEMVDSSHSVCPVNTLQDNANVYGSTKSQTQSRRGTLIPRNKFVHETEKDDGYKTAGTTMNHRSTENVKVSEDEEAFSIINKEST